MVSGVWLIIKQNAFTLPIKTGDLYLKAASPDEPREADGW